MAEAVEALRTRGRATLPDYDAHQAIVVRATWRWWLHGRAWAPLLLAPAAGPGLLATGGPPGPEQDALGVDPARARDLDTDEVDLLRRLDTHHLAASDPTLARARDVLLSQVRAGELVYVQGPPGSGRASLGAWALELGALHSPGRAPAVPPGSLVRDVEDAPEETRADVAAEVLLRADLRGVPVLSRPGARPPSRALSAILGRDPAFCRVLDATLRYAQGTAPVLILGETGVGKEGFAEAVHLASGRKGRLVKLDLASRPSDLQGDDLFGHVAHAFTGAAGPRLGAAREADGGTLFLDELGNLPLAAQARLLRLLENGEVTPLGSDTPVRVDVRVVAATNADLGAMVAAETFRADLRYRLEGCVLRVPPLRERPGDVLELARSFLPAGFRLSPPAEEALIAWRWPGNVRELRRVLERAAAEAAPDGEIGREHLGEVGLRLGRVLTGQVEPAALGPPFTRRHAQILAALPVRLGPPAERGEGCVANALHHALAGREVAPEAMERLTRAPWWGNLVELHVRVRHLLGTCARRIEVEDVAALLPLADQGRVPILTLFGPVVRPDGRVSGLSDTYHDGALVIGRVESLSALGPPSTGPDRRAWIERQLRGAVPAFLAFRMLGSLSRAHVLVTRERDGLAAAAVPGAALATVAGPLGAPRPVPPGERVFLGPAGEIRVEGEGAPTLELFVFLGEAALADAEAALAARCGGTAIATARADSGPRRVRPLEPDERAVLVMIVAEIVERGAEFGPYLTRRLTQLGTPAAAAVAHLCGGQKPTQSAGRLFEYGANELLRRELRAELERRGLLDRLAALPAAIRSTLR